ncbi:BAI1-associated protein 3-like [Oscarella lobularis]|uniref:BAI1-associated protein 3-like n=1 Tax=Oscarella lobularis TaxID=121494 RepID=UPI003313759D
MATSYRRSPTLSSSAESNRSGSDLWALVRSLYRLGMFGRLRIRHKSISRSTRTKEEENARAKQLDGSFFETLNAQHIQENEIEIEAPQVESDKSGGDDYGVPFDYLTIAPLSSKELEIAYKSLLKTAQFWLGAKETSIEKIRDQCHAYMKKVFDVDERQHSDWLSWTKTHVKPPKQFVRVSIIEGRNLPPKDPNGLSDPYCILGVVRLDPGMLDGKSKTKHVKDLVKDESKLATTAVIPTTLNPKWNEQFDIDIEDVKKEYIQIDIWDSDSEENIGDAIKNIKKVQGLFGLKRYFRQIAQTTVGGTEDDFMGRAHIPLKEISSDGFEGWIQIRTRRQRPKKGEIFVRIQLMADSKSTKSDEAFDEHRKIRRQFVHHEATQLRDRGGEGATCSWNGQLSNHASDLLNQHAIQTGVTDLEVAITDWIVTAEYNEKHGVRGSSLLQALTRLEGEWEKVVALQRDPLDELGKDKTDKLVASIDSYRKWARKILVKFRHVFSATRKDSPQRFLAFLQCLLLSFNLPVAKIHLWENDFVTFVESAVSESAQYWFTQRYAVAQPIVESEQNEVLSLVEFAHDCVVELYRARQLDKIVFKRLHICFFQITFKQIEKLLSPIVELRIQNATKHLTTLSFDSDEFVEVATATFKLYLTIKETFSLRAELPIE